MDKEMQNICVKNTAIRKFKCASYLDTPFPALISHKLEYRA